MAVEEELLEFVRLVDKMRQNQKAYFKTKELSYLIESKNLEKQVDSFIEEYRSQDGR